MDATIVTRMLEAGCTITGRAVCENMCHSATSHSASTGVVHNPYAMGYSSGGSSSGSGALVASGAVDMAIGADQGGSIRVPAGWCGIFGLKPTFGLIPFTGCGSNEPTNDHLGPMTRTLLDNALLLQVIAGTDGIDDRSFGAPIQSAVPAYYDKLLSNPTPMDLTGMKIGVITESLDMPGMDPRVLATFLASVEKFKKLGATVEQVSIPMHKHGASIWTGISKAGGAASKMGMAFGRRGHVLNDLNAQLVPLTQESWDKAYPRYYLFLSICLQTYALFLNTDMVKAPKTYTSTAYMPAPTSPPCSGTPQISPSNCASITTPPYAPIPYCLLLTFPTSQTRMHQLHLQLPRRQILRRLWIS